VRTRVRKHSNWLFGMIFLFATGCTQEVPPGYVGMRVEGNGLDGRVLNAGRHTCWGRCQLVMVETTEETTNETLSVLCADDLNFKFDLKIRSRLRTTNGKLLKGVLDKQGAKLKTGKLSFRILYDTYIKPAARSAARATVSRYKTTEIRENRKKITDAIRADIIKETLDTPIEIRMVVTSNFDYPEVITKAVEKRRLREIEIGEEKAKQAMEFLRAENRMKIAEKMKAVRTAEADAEAAYNQILAKSLTDSYLKLRNIEAHRALFQRVGPGDKVIVTGCQQGLIQPTIKP
jgi:hypothetical protein